ncbi:hypothetical protein NEOLEDRAFT_1073073 [Neolentinus lepideus HHB14362 ss-1]|uniref:Copper transport protein n=1 Tax=Neolentinus lepideus HHB14362 ss-1 TaxID=1314782 RepID=A0A165PZI5_9AGAM|nr:hypothetical protein NEOLEDRAFT_1073073 [Neolentinus lepideus HHB14362 ss-1]
MTPWLHFAAGDNLIFEAWHPDSKGAIAGASIALVVFSILERWVAAFRAVMEARWRIEARTMLTKGADVIPLESSCHTASDSKSDEGEIGVELRYRPDAPPSQEKVSAKNERPHTRVFAPFIPVHDLSRGALFALQALMGYVLMLAVMTFQAAYIISIIGGLGIGEALFGRMGSALRTVH